LSCNSGFTYPENSRPYLGEFSAREIPGSEAVVLQFRPNFILKTQDHTSENFPPGKFSGVRRLPCNSGFTYPHSVILLISLACSAYRSELMMLVQVDMVMIRSVSVKVMSF